MTELAFLGGLSLSFLKFNAISNNFSLLYTYNIQRDHRHVNSRVNNPLQEMLGVFRTHQRQDTRSVLSQHIFWLSRHSPPLLHLLSLRIRDAVEVKPPYTWQVSPTGPRSVSLSKQQEWIRERLNVDSTWYEINLRPKITHILLGKVRHSPLRKLTMVWLY